MVYLREQNIDAETHQSSQTFRFFSDSVDRMCLGMVLVMILVYNMDEKIEGKLFFPLSYCHTFIFKKGI